MTKETMFLKKAFCIEGKSPDSFTKADIIAKPKADKIINIIPLILLLIVRLQS